MQLEGMQRGKKLPGSVWDTVESHGGGAGGGKKNISRRDFLKLAGLGLGGLAFSPFERVAKTAESKVNSREFIEGVGVSFARLQEKLAQFIPEQRKGPEAVRLTKAWLLFHGLRAAMLDRGHHLTAQTMELYHGRSGDEPHDVTNPNNPWNGLAQVATMTCVKDIVVAAAMQGGGGEWIHLDETRIPRYDRRFSYNAYDGTTPHEAARTFEDLPAAYEAGQEFGFFFGQNHPSVGPDALIEDMAFLLGRGARWEIEMHRPDKDKQEAFFVFGEAGEDFLDVALDMTHLRSMSFGSTFGAVENPFDGLKLHSAEVAANVNGVVSTMPEWSGGFDTTDVQRAVEEGVEHFAEICQDEGLLEDVSVSMNYPWGGYDPVIREIALATGVRHNHPVTVKAEMFRLFEEHGLATPMAVVGKVENTNQYLAFGEGDTPTRAHIKFPWHLTGERVPSSPPQTHSA